MPNTGAKLMIIFQIPHNVDLEALYHRESESVNHGVALSSAFTLKSALNNT